MIWIHHLDSGDLDSSSSPPTHLIWIPVIWTPIWISVIWTQIWIAVIWTHHLDSGDLDSSSSPPTFDLDSDLDSCDLDSDLGALPEHYLSHATQTHNTHRQTYTDTHDTHDTHIPIVHFQPVSIKAAPIQIMTQYYQTQHREPRLQKSRSCHQV